MIDQKGEQLIVFKHSVPPVSPDIPSSPPSAISIAPPEGEEPENQVWTEADWANYNAEMDTATNSSEYNREMAADFINTVATDLASSLPHTIAHQIIESKATAIGIAQKLRLNEEAMDPNDPIAWEKGALLLALAHKWDGQKSLSQRKMLARQIAALYQKTDRNKVLVDSDKLAYGLPHETFVDILKTFWPESEGDKNWIRENVAKDRLVIFPRKLSDPGTHQLLDEIYDKSKIPLGQRVYFAGIASYDAQLAYVWQDSTMSIRYHELNHLQPGFRIGALASGLNEGVTDWLALRQDGNSMNKINSKIDSFDLGERPAYNDELFMLKKLYALNPKLQDLIEVRYSHLTLANSKQMTVALIDTLGLENYLNLFLVRPKIKALRTTNTLGYLSARAFGSSLSSVVR